MILETKCDSVQWKKKIKNPSAGKNR